MLDPIISKCVVTRAASEKMYRSFVVHATRAYSAQTVEAVGIFMIAQVGKANSNCRQ